MLEATRRWIGLRLTQYLSQTTHASSIVAPTDPDTLLACLRPGDVLLIEGHTRVSSAIKYLTQSTWSHSALYVGDAAGVLDSTGKPCSFIEADIRHGVRAVALSHFKGLNSRVCRPVGLRADDIAAVIAFAIERLGLQYDVRHIVDLARYLLPTPPVPARWRRRMIALGSGSPTRAICSTLIAQAFQSVKYPILPRIELLALDDPDCDDCVGEILHVRHHSLFVPRDFDLSPYFEIIKPTVATGFDPYELVWNEAADASPTPDQARPPTAASQAGHALSASTEAAVIPHMPEGDPNGPR